jgi:hypothetical protein
MLKCIPKIHLDLNLVDVEQVSACWRISADYQIINPSVSARVWSEMKNYLDYFYRTYCLDLTECSCGLWLNSPWKAVACVWYWDLVGQQEQWAQSKHKLEAKQISWNPGGSSEFFLVPHCIQAICMRSWLPMDLGMDLAESEDGKRGKGLDRPVCCPETCWWASG